MAAGTMPVMMSEHLAPPERPVAPVDDPFDFSWCSGEVDGVGAPEECGGHWRWDPRTMFTASAVQVAGPPEPVPVRFVCFRHHIVNTYGMVITEDKLGRTHFSPPQIDFWPMPFQGLVWRLGGRRAAYAWWRLLYRGVRVRPRGWRYAPLARGWSAFYSALWNAAFHLREAWQEAWHGHDWRTVPWWPDDACPRCGVREAHMKAGWLRGGRYGPLRDP